MLKRIRAVAATATLITFGTIAPSHAAVISGESSLSVHNFDYGQEQTSVPLESDRFNSSIAIRRITAPGPSPLCSPRRNSARNSQLNRRCIRLPSWLPLPNRR